MTNLTYKHTYRRKLPHVQPPGATLFITFRLAGSLPSHIIETLRQEFEQRLAIAQKLAKNPKEEQQAEYEEQKRFFAYFDNYLDNTQDGSHWLNNQEIAQLVSESLHHRHNRVYDLDTFCILSNHVHLLFTPLEKEDGNYHSLSSIMHSLKRRTAVKANKLLNREGSFWQHESYDHYVRDDIELYRIRQYILNNPVKAGLISDWSQWPWTFTRYP